MKTVCFCNRFEFSFSMLVVQVTLDLSLPVRCSPAAISPVAASEQLSPPSAESTLLLSSIACFLPLPPVLLLRLHLRLLQQGWLPARPRGQSKRNICFSFLCGASSSSSWFRPDNLRSRIAARHACGLAHLKTRGSLHLLTLQSLRSWI